MDRMKKKKQKKKEQKKKKQTKKKQKKRDAKTRAEEKEAEEKRKISRRKEDAEEQIERFIERFFIYMRFKRFFEEEMLPRVHAVEAKEKIKRDWTEKRYKYYKRLLGKDTKKEDPFTEFHTDPRFLVYLEKRRDGSAIRDTWERDGETFVRRSKFDPFR